MGGRMARNKGKAGERQACEALKDVWPGLKRIYGQARARSGAADIDAPGCPVHIEVKRTESRSVYEAMRQAVEAAQPEMGRAEDQVRPPVIVHRRNRGEWLVTVRASDLARLVGR